MSYGVFRPRYFLPPRLPLTPEAIGILTATGAPPVQNDYVVGNPNNLAGGTWFDVDVGSNTLGTAIDGLPQPIILAASVDYARTSTTINPSWTNAVTYYAKLEFNYGTSGQLRFTLYDGANESVFTWDGTTLTEITEAGGTFANVVEYTVDGHKELYFEVTAVRTNATIEIGVGPNSVSGQNITLFDYHLSDTPWPEPDPVVKMFMLVGQNGTYISRIM